MRHHEGKDGDGPSVLADLSTHNLVIARLAGDYPEEARGGKRLLDIPCGAGAVSARLRELGFTVSCSDIDRGNFELEGYEFTEANLNRAVSLADSSFDIVVSIAGLQRLITPETAIDEFYRILQPGGRLYLAVPNFSNLKMRLRYLFYGSLGKRFERPRYRQTIADVEANFRFPITFARVRELLLSSGFRQKAVLFDRRGVQPFVLFPFTVMIWLAGRIMPLFNREKYGKYRESTTVGSLRSVSFVVVAEKPGLASD